ncbi:SCO1 family protein [Tribonema minus]|uniref:SCO1 family protein n=1 Tax=Tribonema minus TaxID=303371 RepID=A0A835ZB06_9STRA|nr:SCO1 family protein [Tribonema minus]
MLHLRHLRLTRAASTCSRRVRQRGFSSKDKGPESTTPPPPPPPPAGASGAASSRRTPVTWASVGLVGIVGAGLAWYYTNEKEKRMTQTVSQVTSIGKPNLGGPWTLVDMHGVPKTDKDYLGSYTLLYFGFAHCPDICPAELVKLGHILQEASKQLKRPVPVKPVFISVDPDRDSLRQLRFYAKDFHPDVDYLTGTKDQVAKAARAYRVYFSKSADHEEDEEYLVDHSIVMYLVNDAGAFVDFYTQRMGVPDCVERLVKELRAGGAV